MTIAVGKQQPVEAERKPNAVLELAPLCAQALGVRRAVVEHDVLHASARGSGRQSKK